MFKYFGIGDACIGHVLVDGVVREYTFLEDMELSLLSQHRKYQPYGMNGGNPGKTGEQFIIKADKSIVEFQGVDHRLIKKGDTFVLKTPGGGGWGEKQNRFQTNITHIERKEK